MNVFFFYSRLIDVRFAEALAEKPQSVFVVLENHPGDNYAAKL